MSRYYNTTMCHYWDMLVIQQVSVAVQQGNALAVMGTFSSTLLGNF